MDPAELIKERDTLHTENAQLRADIARVTAERDMLADKCASAVGRETTALADLAALRARVAELEERAERYRLTTLRQDARNAELVAALRYYVSVKGCHGEYAAWPKLKDALARAESATSAKHPDTEIVDWLEKHLYYAMVVHEGKVAMESLKNNGAGWENGELRAAVNAARKQGGSHD